MKKKSKSDNKKDQKKPGGMQSMPAAEVPAFWLFVSRREIGVRDIKDALEGFPGADIEIWEAAGVLEITLEDGKSIDLEETACDLGDDYSNRFLEENGAKTLLYVTIRPESYALAAPVMRAAAEKLDGFFCGDTDDFKPRVP